MATLRSWRSVRLFQALVCVVAFSLAWLQVSPAYGIDVSLRRETARQEAWRLAHLPHVGLPTGLTQTPDAALQKKIAAKEAVEQKPKTVADVRPLSEAEMGQALGRGPLRNPYFAGAPMPWHRSFHDVNLCTGNLFKSFTDVQVAPARGAGLVLQRTYNSNEARVGPFGIGWTHAYDIRVQEAADVSAEDANKSIDTTTDDVPRTDFFGHKHTYHRDADGLYSPPPYLYDETKSDYNTALVTGPIQVMDDTEKGMDGTVKHYVNVVTKADGSSGNERACDYIQDRYGNTTTLTYGLSYVQVDGSTRKLLTQVADPTGRTLTFQWTNFGTVASPVYRITEVDGPTDLTTGSRTYRVTYAYYIGTEPAAGGAAYQLKSVTLDPDGLNRTTTYTYTSYSGTSGSGVQGTDNGLLTGITDPLGNVVSYSYTLNFSNFQNESGTSTGTLWICQCTEPAGVDVNNTPRTLTWTTDSPQGSSSVLVNWNSCFFQVATDQQLRFIHIGELGAGAGFFCGYDTDNNITLLSDSLYGGLLRSSVHREDDYTFGQHGNQLTHSVGGFSPVENTTYYNASQYFAEQSATDMNGHTTIMGIGTSTAGTPGASDSNVGDRGQLLWVQDADYNNSNSPSYQKRSTFVYNAYGQKTLETNLNGVITHYYYGGDGSSFDTADTDADDTGDLIAVVQNPGGAGHLNRTTTMHYDIMGRLLQSTDPMRLTSNFTYNTLGQPLTVHAPVKSGTPAETILYAYDENGRTHSVTDNRGSTVITYEANCDRVRSVTDPVTGTIAYTYTLDGQRQTVVLPGGGTWTYAYTVTGIPIIPSDKPDDIRQGAGTMTITDDQGRHVDYYIYPTGKMSNVMSDETFDQSGNMVDWSKTIYFYDYSSTGRIAVGPTHYWLTKVYTDWYNEGSTTATIPASYRARSDDYTAQGSDATTGYDLVGNRLSDAITDSNGNVRTERYTYDDLNRLSTVDYGDGETQSYGFDPMGNRLTKSDASGSTTTTSTYAYDAANRLTSTSQNGGSASAVTSDADGNTLTDSAGRAMTWDSQNRMASCTYKGTTSIFTYGADGLRHQAIVNGVTTDYAYDGQTLVREGFASGGSLGTVKATYLTGPRGPEYRRDDTQTEIDSQGRQVSKARWYVYDGLGSVVGEMDVNGNLTSSPKYDVYGLVRSNPGTVSSAMGFVGGLGHLSEAGTGLIYMRARYYDAALGRFASEDPAENGTNWFIYCGNNPITGVDPTGLQTLTRTSGSGELDYDLAGAAAGLGALAAVLIVIGGYLADVTLQSGGVLSSREDADIIKRRYKDRWDVDIDRGVQGKIHQKLGKLKIGNGSDQENPDNIGDDNLEDTLDDLIEQNPPPRWKR